MFRRTLILALAALAMAAVAQAQAARPTPSLFQSGDCKAETCVRQRWLDFLKSHGEAELAPGAAVQVRLTVLNAETCPGAKDAVDILRFTLGGTPGEARNRCGARTTPALSAAHAATLTRLLADPQAAAIAGEFPVYCSDGDEGRTVELHLLEILQGDRYRLITWDCEPPEGLKPLAAFFEAERPRLP
jgi:hypothetical protein